MEVNSIYKPHYYFTAHYIPETNQLVWEGFVSPKGVKGYDVFCMFENASELTVQEFLMEVVGLVEDPSDIMIHVENKDAIVAGRIIDARETVWIVN